MDYFNYGRTGRPARTPSNIRIQRLPSSHGTPLSREGVQAVDQAVDHAADDIGNRRRSFSAPQRPSQTDVSSANLSRLRSAEDGRAGPAPMATVTEEDSARSPQNQAMRTPGLAGAALDPQRPGGPERSESGLQAITGAANAARQNRGLRRFRSNIGTQRVPPQQQHPPNEYDSDVVDLLDLVDPEVSTLGTLTNVQNSLFVPDLGSWLNRRPTYQLTQRPSSTLSIAAPRPRSRAGTRAAADAQRQRAGTLQPIEQGKQTQFEDEDVPDNQSGASRRVSISSALSDSHYAVLPHGMRLEAWTEEDKAELNDHVRHLLHSRKEGLKRSWRGFRKYLSKPLGLFVTSYAVLVTVFGTVWVFLLIGWIYAGDERQDYIIDIIDNILVALFALIGDGMAPFRAVDTYHMCFIAMYHHQTWQVREKHNLPALRDHNDLPVHRRESVGEADLEAGMEKKPEFSVLTPAQQARLQYHQDKFAKSHTFYKPHETATHHAFPLRLLVAIVVLLDFHSLFQVALGTCTWSINYRVRPESLTSTILACSLTCNIVAGILISIGDKRTRKKEVLERLFRQDLTHEAIRKIQKRRNEEGEPAPEVIEDDVVEQATEKVASEKRDIEQEEAEIGDRHRQGLPVREEEVIG